MTRSGLRLHMTRTPKQVAKTPKPKKGKTLQQVREKGHKR